ncbi:MAG: DUF72 domain-containing protein [Planctomycetes bacterium]|nr:DUF72 domain-containing protein [Planctomycetota bacterium]
MSEFLYGTSSWSEKSWDGVFYPAGMQPGEYLTHYATQFRTVEADVTYYRVPDQRLVEGWKRKTPEGFVLAAKFPQTIVHGGAEARPDPAKVLVPDAVGADTVRFIEAMRLLGPKCGPLVLQFPYFNMSVFPSVGPFLQRLDAFLGTLPPDLRYVVEIRNRPWLATPLLDLLRRRRVALALVDLAYMPHPLDLPPTLDLITTDFAYVRLIGDRKAIDERTKTFDKIVVDQRPKLARWADLLRALFPRVGSVYAYANNHFAGHGPATIRELADLVAAPGANAPASPPAPPAADPPAPREGRP